MHSLGKANVHATLILSDYRFGDPSINYIALCSRETSVLRKGAGGMQGKKDYVRTRSYKTCCYDLGMRMEVA